MLHSTNTARPLLGKRILVTRTREQASSFSEHLRKLGAIPVEFPIIRIVPPLDWQPLDDALRRLCGATFTYYDWLIFTSVNGVESVFGRLNEFGLTIPVANATRVAAIGPATAATLARYGVQTDLVPGEYIAEGVVAALIEDAQLRGTSLAGKRVLLPRAAVARDVLVTELKAASAIVQEVAAYRTLPVSSDDAQGLEVVRMLQAGELHMLTFTSSSTVRNFMQWLMSSAPAMAEKLRADGGETLPSIACIGPITAQTAREMGLHPQIEATTFTIDGLIEAIVQHEGKI
ncbi:MAG TPA: uroporphyrinogen-III synthase [Ktedonobacteraceae bacterium]|nr:uroporphyrinogen-III synthase [Ktedonobacteraceae bacterium]